MHVNAINLYLHCKSVLTLRARGIRVPKLLANTKVLLFQFRHILPKMTLSAISQQTSFWAHGPYLHSRSHILIISLPARNCCLSSKPRKHMAVDSTKKQDWLSWATEGPETWRKVMIIKLLIILICFTHAKYTCIKYTHTEHILICISVSSLQTLQGILCRKAILVMYLNCQPTSIDTVTRRQWDGSKIAVPCTEAIQKYNELMGGVDRGDQTKGYFSCRTKSRKFYRFF